MARVRLVLWKLGGRVEVRCRGRGWERAVSALSVAVSEDTAGGFPDERRRWFSPEEDLVVLAARVRC